MNSKIQLLGASGASVAAIAMAAFFPRVDPPIDARAYSTSVPDDVPNTYGVEETPEAKLAKKPSPPITVAPIAKEQPIKAAPKPATKEKVVRNRHRKPSYSFTTRERVDTRVSRFQGDRPSEGRHRYQAPSHFFSRR
jgi:hypothetical protein